MIRIVMRGQENELEKLWRSFALSNNSGNEESLPELEIEDEFDERSIDGGSVLTIFELGASFVMGVSSGLLANWLGDLFNDSRTTELQIGSKVFKIPTDTEIERANIINKLHSEIEELKRLAENNE